MEFQFGDWLVSPEANIVSNGDAKTQLEPRVMAVLRYLCRHPGAVIPAEEILQACWGSNELGDNPVHKAITQLRRAFGDSSTEPRYIETIRKRGYRAIAPIVTLASTAQTVWEGGSPFRGLEAFQENHAAIFFGRVQATAQLRGLVMTQAAHGCPMALVLGPSGSGKTSLVRAGLLPQLMAGATRSDEPVGLVSTVYLDCADLGSGTLFQALAGALIDADIDGEPLFPGASADSLGQRLANEPEAVAAELHSRPCSRVAVGVFVDRLEAVFRAEPAVADRFFDVIDALAESNCLLMLMACRNDFYPEVMAQPALLALKSRGGHFDVLPPDGVEISQIVRQPAQAANLKFEQDEITGASLDDVLCDATRGNHDMLPLLQYTLNELYRQRSDDGMLKFEVYRQLGGIEGAVGVRAEQVVSALNRPEIAALPHVLSLLVNVGDDQSAITSRRSPLSMLRDDDARELVRVMVEARLFVSELAGDVPSFGVAHEALLRQWPRFAEWIERHRNALQLRTRISAQATRWIEAGRNKDLLLPRGSQVSQAADLLTLQDFALAPHEGDFVRTSIQRAKFADRVRVAVTTLVGFLAVLTTIFGIGARSAQREAERNRSEAEGLMTFMLGDFVEKLRPIGKLDLLDDVGSKAITYLGRRTSDASSTTSLINRIKALRIIAEVHLNRSRKADGIEAMTAAQALIKDAPAALQDNTEFVTEVGKLNAQMGQSHLQNNEFDLAEKCFQEYLKFSTRLSELQPDAIEGLKEQYYAKVHLGSLAMRRSNFDAAAKEFTEAVKLNKSARLKKPDDPLIALDLAGTTSWSAESLLKSGHPRAAMKLYREEEELLRSVDQGSATSASKLALSLMRQGLLYVAFGDRQEAVRVLKEAQEIMRALVAKDPSNDTWKSRLLQAEGRLVEAQLTQENAKISYSRLQEVCDQMAELLKRDPQNSFLAYQSVKFELGRTTMLQALGRDKEALQNVDRALASLGAFHKKAPKDNILIAFLAEGLMARAELSQKSDRAESVSVYCEQANELLASAANVENDMALLSLQTRADLCRGDSGSAIKRISRLREMGYNDARFMQLISSHPLMKGKL